MKLNKDTLNCETLFNSRKQFGMYGNIQWHVREVQGNHLMVQASSERTDIDTGIVGMNIVKSIQRVLPNTRTCVHWVTWKPEHGRGVIVPNEGKTKDQITQELLTKLNA